MVQPPILGPLYGIRNSAAVYWLMTPAAAYDTAPLIIFSPRIKPPIVILPVPLSSFDNVEAGIPLEQEVWPGAAIAMVAKLLVWPPLVTVSKAKHPGEILKSRTKCTCHKPG